MGSSVGGKCPHSGGGCCIREAVYLWGQGVYGESLYLLLNFPLNLKLSLKKKKSSLKKKKILSYGLFQNFQRLFTGTFSLRPQNRETESKLNSLRKLKSNKGETN